MILLKNRLELLRNEKKITQKYLSCQIYVSQESISAYEIGKHLPTIDVLIKLADYFGVSTDYLLGRDDLKTRVSDKDLDPFEKSLLNSFRKLNELDRELVVKLLSETVDFFERRKKP